MNSTGRVKATALGIAALREDEKCSFTLCKLRLFIFSRFALPSLVTFLHGLSHENFFEGVQSYRPSFTSI